MKWMSSLATCLERVIDRICWQKFWRSENPYKVSFQPANQHKLSWWSALSTASCSSQWPRKRGTVRHRTCPPAFEREEEQIWLSLAEIQNRHRPITITYSHSSGSAWRNENYLPVSQSQSIRITTASSSQSMPKPRSSNPLAFCSFVCWTSTTCVSEALLDLAARYLHQACSSVLRKICYFVGELHQTL